MAVVKKGRDYYGARTVPKESFVKEDRIIACVD